MKDRRAACMVSIEIDSRQAYLFETDKWQEMLGASQIIAATREWARDGLKDDGIHLVQPVSGEIRAWALLEDRDRLLAFAWELRLELARRGVEHTCGYLETLAGHFCESHDTRTTYDPAADRPDDRNPDVLPSLATVHGRMTERTNRRKTMKAGTDARPVCSLFAACRLHGLDFANVWESTENAREPDEERRRQCGFRARAKREFWHGKRKALAEAAERDVRDALGQHASVAHLLGQLEFEPDFAEEVDRADGQQDRYIAFLCADGDGFGTRFLPAIDWNWSFWNDGRQPWERNREFVEALVDTYRQSFHDAMVATSVDAIAREIAAESAAKSTDPNRPPRIKYRIPVLLQLLGGDDLWVLARRDVALDLARRFSHEFSTGAVRRSELKTALEIAGERGVQMTALTLSVGVAFAKSGYPVHAMAEAAEELLGGAKRLRKGELPDRDAATEGCLDWHRIESSLSERVLDARRRGWLYEPHEPGVRQMRLTTRPWTGTQARAFDEARRHFEGVPRRKRQQLEDVLRRGYTLSLLAWEAWCKSLTSGELECLTAARDALHEACGLQDGDGTWDTSFPTWRAASPAPGTTFETPWLDLLALEDVAGGADA